MDIVEIGVSRGNPVDLMKIVDPSMRQQCEKYLKQFNGPKTVLRNDAGKTPIQYYEEAFEPLKKYLPRIGAVIDGSTTRGFTEPSTASLYSQHIKVDRGICFDVYEAGNGWARAIETAYMMYQTNPKFDDKYILVTNNEQPPTTRATVPKNPNDEREAFSYFEGLTQSYVCTCTILKKSNNHSWKFTHEADYSQATSSSVPFPFIAKGWAASTADYKLETNDNYGIFSLPNFGNSEKRSQFVQKSVRNNREFYDNANVVCHTQANQQYSTVFNTQKVKKVSTLYNEFGNLGSASMPYTLYQQYGNVLPQGENLTYCGSNCGSEMIINFTHGIKTEDKFKFQQEQKGIFSKLFGCTRRNTLATESKKNQ